MSPRQLRVRDAVRFTALTVIIVLWLVLAHAIPAAVVWAVGL